MNEIIVRHVLENDDYAQIASCIYLTDPYIYPAAFGYDKIQAIKAISKLMHIEEGLFSKNRILLALIGKEICGTLLFNSGGAKWDTGASIEYVKEYIPCLDNFRRVADTYFAHEAALQIQNGVEVIACCVKPEFRNMGVGRHMLEHLMHEYPKHTLELDVLADNSAAIRLYHKCGFEIVDKCKGFCLDEEKRPECYRMVKVCDAKIKEIY